jgi:hypothetical protein
LLHGPSLIIGLEINPAFFPLNVLRLEMPNLTPDSQKREALR